MILDGILERLPAKALLLPQVKEAGHETADMVLKSPRAQVSLVAQLSTYF